MRLLPKSEMTIQRLSDGRVIVGAHEDCGYRHYKILSASDFTDDQIWGAVAAIDCQTINASLDRQRALRS